MSSKHVVILGAGTVGSSLIDYLLQFDVQNFTIIDGDTVMAKNIPHQRNYVPTEIGMYKCDIAKEHILQVNPNCHVDIYKQFLNTTDEFLSCICNSSVDAIFWAIDQYDSNLLGGIYDWSTASNVPIYLSGYSSEDMFVASDCLLNLYKISRIFRITPNILSAKTPASAFWATYLPCL